MKHVEVEVTGISDLISKLEAHRSPGDKAWFRGHADISWGLAPSISRQRENPVQDEFAYFKKFKQDAARVVSDLPSDEWGWMFLMQHYGIPTRLLDFSENPLVALYFAVSSHPGADGALYVMDPVAWNAENGMRGSTKDDIPLCGIDEEMSQYMMSSAMQTIGVGQSAPALAAIGARNSRRIFAQEGTFVVFHHDMDMDGKVQNADCKSVWRYRISATNKELIKRHLALLSINEFSIFPELDKLAKKIVG
ncbi:FRG domain-containing protein [Pseudomonas sp. PDM19]|uniref:FRG domain-containing protein n=1 Tax=Pseudomonas sp. PDM19 TaxID=2769272 RepID=UPI0017815089|nr:FRG domain-containing protein [Pseudomonas sp. PDM19]MBD9630160.1 FRG domain-containing protein [Pseudomonas sp. PDM19]